MRKTIKEAAVTHLATKRLNGESIDKIAEEIVMISDGIKKLRQTRLTDDTLMLLIQNAIGSSKGTQYKLVSIKVIKAVLNGMAELESRHLKPKGQK